MIRQRIAAAAFLTVLALGAGACGGSEEDDGAPPGGQPQARQGFAECLRGQGVDLPAGRQGGGRPPFDPSDPDIRHAFEACRDELPEGAGPR